MTPPDDGRPHSSSPAPDPVFGSDGAEGTDEASLPRDRPESTAASSGEEETVSADPRESDGSTPELPGLQTTEPGGDWEPDVMDGFESKTFAISEDDQGTNLVTIVRPVADERDHRRTPVLLIHGWADYFYNEPAAAAFENAGYAFHAMDLQRYGRSLREGQTPGWTDTLMAYDADIETALGEIGRTYAKKPIIVAHSTGGLVSALWADRHPGRLQALVLNSPWLEMQGSTWVRHLAKTIVDPVANRQPYAMLKLPKVDFYWRTLSSEAEGEWDLHPLWRPKTSFEVPAAWLGAVLVGHAQVKAGLDIQEPVLTLVSERGFRGAKFSDEMKTADIVLEPTAMAARALLLGRRVTIHRYADALHDVFASPEDIRNLAFTDVLEWLEAYGR